MALQILHQLEAASGRLEKEAILKAHATDPVFKEVCRLTLDPLVNFYIKKLPEAGVARPGADVWSLNEALESIKTHLATRALRGNAATTHVHRLLTCLEPDDREVLRRVLGRNLKCGVSESTVEKIWPDLKLSYPCMLVSPMDSKTKLSFPMYSQVKSDGARFNAIIENRAVHYRSRNGKEIDLFGSMDHEFLEMAGGRDLVFDGELLVVGPDGKPLDRKTGNGLLTKFQKGTGSKTVAASLRAVVWDLIPLEEFRKGKGTQTYRERYATLLAALQTPGVSKVVGVETTTAHEPRPLIPAVFAGLKFCRRPEVITLEGRGAIEAEMVDLQFNTFVDDDGRKFTAGHIAQLRGDASEGVLLTEFVLQLDLGTAELGLVERLSNFDVLDFIPAEPAGLTDKAISSNVLDLLKNRAGLDRDDDIDLARRRVEHWLDDGLGKTTRGIEGTYRARHGILGKRLSFTERDEAEDELLGDRGTVSLDADGAD